MFYNDLRRFSNFVRRERTACSLGVLIGCLLVSSNPTSFGIGERVHALYIDSEELKDNSVLVKTMPIQSSSSEHIESVVNTLATRDTITEKDLLEREEKRQEALERAAEEAILQEKQRIAKEVEERLCSVTGSNVPNNEAGCRSYNKTFMDYRKVTNQTSRQYALLFSDDCYTDMETGIRMVDGRYCIAVGTGYCSEIGTKIDLVMSNGSTLECILGDVKSPDHTDATNRYHVGGYDNGIYYEGDGSVAEFIIDGEVFDKSILSAENGDKRFVGRIEKVVVLPEHRMLESDV